MEDEQATFIEMEEIYKTAIDDANRIIKGEFRAPQPERAVQLAAQTRGLHEQVMGILNRAKEEMDIQSEAAKMESAEEAAPVKRKGEE